MTIVRRARVPDADLWAGTLMANGLTVFFDTLAQAALVARLALNALKLTDIRAASFGRA